MTRINAGVAPAELHRRHLIAEYREIVMVPAALNRSLRTRKVQDILAGIPKEFTLNAGHVTFFYDKLLFLADRLESLIVEMKTRGYRTDDSRSQAFLYFPSSFYNDWDPTPEARGIVLERIAKRIAEKPHLYT